MHLTAQAVAGAATIPIGVISQACATVARCDRRTRCVQRGDAHIPFEPRLSIWCEIHDVECPRIRTSSGTLDGGIADHQVVPNQVIDGTTPDVDAIGVSGYRVFLDDVAARRADDSNPEIVWGLRVAITLCCVQPDPAVMADDSYAAALQSGG